MKFLLAIFFVVSTSLSMITAQCPEGPEPFFWHPDQVDSFLLIYPNCDNYDWSFHYENGEIVKPSKASNIKYLLVLTGLLSSILILLKIITQRIRYFN